MAHHETNHSTTLAISLVIVFLLVVAFGAAVRMNGQPVDTADLVLGVPKLDISITQLTKERAAIAQPRATPAELETYFARVREINRLQFGPQTDKTLEDASIMLMESVNELAVAQGSYHFILTASDPLVHECQNGIEPVLTALGAKSLAWADAIVDPAEGFEKYRNACGNVLPMLESLRIVGQDGSWTDPKNGPALFSILNRLRIASLVHDRIPSVQQLTPHERDALYTWRFGNPALSLDEKVRFAESAIFDIPNFPKDEWLGRIYFDAGKLHEANVAYKLACKQRKADKALQMKCLKVQEMVDSKRAPAENG